MFVKDTLVAEAPEVEFEGFGLDDFLVGDVTDGDFGKIRLAGGGAEAGEFVGAQCDDVISPFVSVGKCFQLLGGFVARLANVGQA